MNSIRLPLLLLLALALPALAQTHIPKSPANRLVYLDDPSPFYPHRDFPKLITPQWVGEEDVEAVLTLGIDDMRAAAGYEKFLRPILERLKKIDGRAPVSIMTCRIAPDDKQVQAWLAEGVSIEVHTLTHPCPLLQKGNFVQAANVVHGGVDLLSQIKGNKPVAYRMPCCDSMNSLSPRFFAEIFNKTSADGRFLKIDSSVFNITTSKDKSLPREWVLDKDGTERFAKYLPRKATPKHRKGMRTMGSYVGTIEDYPYPYVVNRLCWEFPCTVPSDWEAQNLIGSQNPQLLEDWKRALDVTVRKQGVMNLVFHPHGWSSSEQLVALIDYAQKTYGKKVKFLNFKECAERLEKNLLKGNPLRDKRGWDNGVRIVDLDNDGFMDVVIANKERKITRQWKPKESKWRETKTPFELSFVLGHKTIAGKALVPDGKFPQKILQALRGLHSNESAKMGVLSKGGGAVIFTSSIGPVVPTVFKWEFIKGEWVWGAGSLPFDFDDVFMFRDVDNDGVCELISAEYEIDKQNSKLTGKMSETMIHKWNPKRKGWERLPFNIPGNVTIFNEVGREPSLRFIDLNGDGFDDIVFSNEKRWGIYLWETRVNPGLGWKPGWTMAREGKRGDKDAIPMISRGGKQPNNGAWFHSGHLWVQNEDTAHLPDVVDRRSFKQLLDFGGPKAKEPKESRRCFQVREGFEVQLVASEPQVRDPVAFDWGADGKLWVAEMGDYPSGTDGKGKAGGVVRWLEDADGDGRYEKSTVFLEGLNFPNGVMPWGKGVLISAAPEILYAEDTTGDGRADVRRVLFTGFREGNQQHRMNGFALGLDNWIYAANGDSGGTITSKATGARTNISGRDFRFKVTGEFEAVAGQTQFGRWRDDWGNWFGNNNPNWLWYYHVPLRYLARNPQLAVGATRRNTFSSNRCFPISAKMVRPNQPQSYGHVTSANSATPYRGGLFGKDFARSVFISEPVHNLVHREVLVPEGVSFKSHRAAGEEKSEFLASTDNWFRPVQMKTGPDGALYIADMYRLVIEHPEWIPAAMQSRVDLRAGHDKGRIWRIVLKGAKLRKIPPLDKLPTQQLVLALDHPNGWQRDTAQRLLIARNDPKSHQLLGSIAANTLRGKILPQARIHALHTLTGLGALNKETLAAALRDDHSAVREHAVRLCEGGNEALARQCLTDKSPRVLRQLAFTLGQGKGQLVTEGLVYLAVQHPKNADLQLAIKSSAAPHAAAMLKQIFSQKARPPAALSNHLLKLATTGEQLDALALVLNDLTPADLTILAGLLDALHARSQTLIDFQKTAPPKLKAALNKTTALFKHARATAANPNATTAERQAAIPLLARGLEPIDADKKTLVKLLAAEHPPALQKTAFATLRKIHQPHLVSALLGSWKTFSPAIRAEAIETLLTRPAWTQALLAALEKGDLPANQISPAHRQKFTKHTDATLRARATQLFGKVDPNRAKVIARYAGVGKLKGNAEDGAFLFKANCAVCHRFKNKGNPVGPDPALFAAKPTADWLIAILDPNRAVEDKYVGYVIITRNATAHTGVITAETPTSLTLRTAIGAEQIILRANIKTLQSTGLSLMPPGLEAALPPAAMADLLAFLQSK